MYLFFCFHFLDRFVASRLAGLPIYLGSDTLPHEICKFAVAHDRYLPHLCVYKTSQSGLAAGTAGANVTNHAAAVGCYLSFVFKFMMNVYFVVFCPSSDNLSVLECSWHFLTCQCLSDICQIWPVFVNLMDQHGPAWTSNAAQIVKIQWLCPCLK